jgi:hypothetical protein
MLRFWLLLGGVVGAGCLHAPVREEAQVTDSTPVPVTLQVLERELEGYGAWLQLPVLGRVWQPALASVGADFYPYGSAGQWVLSEAGWVFDSAFPFGRAVFHYGRWSLEPGYGWVWTPGTTWAPAWVAWRLGGPYVGWAALGPKGAPPLVAGRGWAIVELKRLRSLSPNRYAVPARRFAEVARLTAPAQGEVARRGPPGALVAAAIGLALPPRSLASVASASTAGWAAVSWAPGAEVLRSAVVAADQPGPTARSANLLRLR